MSFGELRRRLWMTVAAARQWEELGQEVEASQGSPKTSVVCRDSEVQRERSAVAAGVVTVMSLCSRGRRQTHEQPMRMGASQRATAGQWVQQKLAR